MFRSSKQDSTISFEKNNNLQFLFGFLMEVNCLCGGQLVASAKRKSFLFISHGQNMKFCEWEIVKEIGAQDESTLDNGNIKSNFLFYYYKQHKKYYKIFIITQSVFYLLRLY